MPSAAASNSKSTEKPAEAGATGESPLATIMTIVEHKIRNLVKRQARLDGYRELQKNGTQLTADQQDAVKKYDEVMHSLDLAKEFSKQFAQIAKEANREAKREAKRTAFLRVQQEANKIREVLIIQDILRSLADDSVRQDFLDGTNGAVKIEQADMDLLEKLYVEVTPKRPARSDEPGFVACATHSANTLSSVIDARTRPFADSSYDHVRDILQSIQTCGYFEKDILQVEESAPAVEDDDQAESVDSEDLKTDSVDAKDDLDPPSDSIEAPAAKVVPVPKQLIITNPPPALPIPVLPVAGAVKDPFIKDSAMYPPLPPNTVPVRAVEYGLQKQYLQQQIRPIHEVIGQGNFSFLQDSELEAAESDFGAPPPLNAPPTQPSPKTLHALTPVTAVLAPPPPTFVAGANPAGFAGIVPPPAMPTFTANPLKTAGDVAPPPPPPHIPTFATQLPTMAAAAVPLAQPVQQIMQQQVAAVAAVAQNLTEQGIRQLPAIVQGAGGPLAQIAQIQNIFQHQTSLQQSATESANALTEKLKSTLHINDSSSKPAPQLSHEDTKLDNSNDWNEAKDGNDEPFNSASNSWSNEMENSYRSGNYKRNSGGYRSDKYTKYQDNKYADNKYASNNSYRSRNNGGDGSYQNGRGNGNRDVFFQNNDRSYYHNNGNGNYKRNDLMRQRVGGGGGGWQWRQRLPYSASWHRQFVRPPQRRHRTW